MKKKKLYTLLATLVCITAVAGTAWGNYDAYVILDGDDGSRTVLMEDGEAPVIVDNPDGTSEIYFGESGLDALQNPGNASSNSDTSTSTDNTTVETDNSNYDAGSSDNSVENTAVDNSATSSDNATVSNVNTASSETTAKTTKTYTDKEIANAWELVTTVDPTCTTDGYKEYKNSLTGKTKTEAIAATGEHTYEVTDSTDATWTEKGSITYTCSACGDTYIEETDMLEHTYEVTDTKDATCTEDGYTKYECTACGDSYEETTKATGHDDGAWVVTKEAGAFATGTKELKCTVCGEVFDTATIPQTCPIPLAGVVAIIAIGCGMVVGVIIAAVRKKKNKAK